MERNRKKDEGYQTDLRINSRIEKEWKRKSLNILKLGRNRMVKETERKRKGRNK